MYSGSLSLATQILSQQSLSNIIELALGIGLFHATAQALVQVASHGINTYARLFAGAERVYAWQ